MTAYAYTSCSSVAWHDMSAVTIHHTNYIRCMHWLRFKDLHKCSCSGLGPVTNKWAHTYLRKQESPDTWARWGGIERTQPNSDTKNCFDSRHARCVSTEIFQNDHLVFFKVELWTQLTDSRRQGHTCDEPVALSDQGSEAQAERVTRAMNTCAILHDSVNIEII